MRFIKPSEISSKIMTLIEESDEFVVIVSPYIKISKWYKLIKKMETLKTRNIPVEIFIRDGNGNENSAIELDQLGFAYTKFPDLHCKLYLNEKYGIVSSMNLLYSSEVNSLELGYMTETEKEYEELSEFCKRYLKIEFSFNKKDEVEITNEEIDWRDFIRNELYIRSKYPVDVWQENGSLRIRTHINNYSCFISNEYNKINLRISGILSRNELNKLYNEAGNLEKLMSVKLEVYKGYRGDYNTVWGTLIYNMKSNKIYNLHEQEQSIVAKKIIEFIEIIDDFKSRN